MSDPPQAREAEAEAVYARELAAAIEAARAAGSAIRAVFGPEQVVAFKSGDDPLTSADTAADRCIRERLRAAFPADGWLSEESHAVPGSEVGRMWVVDPLDGTREFVQQIPEFAVSIALLADGSPVVAVVYNPMRDHLVSAVRHGGAVADGRPVATSRAGDLATATLLASRSEVRRGQWSRLEGRCHVRPTGSIAYKLALVACGEADATISLAPKHGWDICAGVLLVEEARGTVTALDGSALDLSHPGDLVGGLIASNTLLHEQLLAAVGHEAQRDAAIGPRTPSAGSVGGTGGSSSKT